MSASNSIEWFDERGQGKREERGKGRFVQGDRGTWARGTDGAEPWDEHGTGVRKGCPPQTDTSHAVAVIRFMSLAPGFWCHAMASPGCRVAAGGDGS